MLTIGRSPPSITPDFAAVTTSPQPVGTALPPTPLLVSPKNCMSSAPFDRVFTSFAIHSKLIAADSGAALTCANTSFFGWVCAIAGERPLARMPAMPALLASKARRESVKRVMGVLRCDFLAGSTALLGDRIQYRRDRTRGLREAA